MNSLPQRLYIFMLIECVQQDVLEGLLKYKFLGPRSSDSVDLELVRFAVE
jgi:hypothetical protein